MSIFLLDGFEQQWSVDPLLCTFHVAANCIHLTYTIILVLINIAYNAYTWDYYVVLKYFVTFEVVDTKELQDVYESIDSEVYETKHECYYDSVYIRLEEV